MKIIIDAMGGDHAPAENIKGALRAMELYGVEIMLVGDETAIRASFSEQGLSIPQGMEIVHASEAITMEEDPVQAIRLKKDSSMVVGLRMLRDGHADAMVSAGSTGALLSGATLIVKRIQGVRRAALAPWLPNKGNGVMLIDCGANVECTPEYLVQFAFMGAGYADGVIGIKNPRIGLLNNGVESHKGTELHKETYKLLTRAKEDGKLNFIGNVEARDVMLGACEVVVCDGFSGNVLLKSIEGTALFVMSEVKKVLCKNLKSKIGALLLKKGLYELKGRMSTESIGGTPMLGISKPVVKAHGSSKAGDICGAVGQAVKAAQSGDIQGLRENMSYIKELCAEEA